MLIQVSTQILAELPHVQIWLYRSGSQYVLLSIAMHCSPKSRAKASTIVKYRDLALGVVRLLVFLSSLHILEGLDPLLHLEQQPLVHLIMIRHLPLQVRYCMLPLVE